MNQQNRNRILISFIPPIAVGILSAILTNDATREVFSTIKRPPLTPPGFLFPIVWTILYFLMGVSTYLILNSKAYEIDIKKALTIFYGQLLINFLWPIVFNNLQLFGLAFLILALLVFLVAINVIAYYRIQELAGILMVPYLLWCIFATYLNLAIVILN